MRLFNLYFSGDYLDETGTIRYGDIGVNALEASGYVKTGFLLDQKPTGNKSYWDSLYSLQIKPEHVAKANGIVIFRPGLEASAFVNGAESLVVVARAGAGYEKIDLGACTDNDVIVINSPDTLTHSTASAALTLMLALAKKLPQQQELVLSGHWERQPEVKGDDLVGQTLGIIGLGKTGAELARLAACFHMRLLAYSPNAYPSQAESLGVKLVELDELLRASDFISLHCRLEKRTRGMLGRRELRMVKPTAYLINVGRGELIQEEVLVEALRDRWLAGAGLDVFETEPLPTTSPLLGLRNVILTPHWLPATHRALRATKDVIVRNVLRIAQGLVPQNILNPEVLGRSHFITKLQWFASNRDQSMTASKEN